MNPDPATMNLIVNGATAAVTLVLSYFLHRLTAKSASSSTASGSTVATASHPILDALEQAAVDQLLQKLQVTTPTPPAKS